MATMVGYSPRQPGCVLLVSDVKNIVLKLQRVWRKLAIRSTPGYRSR
jgi:hypothetical protein